MGSGAQLNRAQSSLALAASSRKRTLCVAHADKPALPTPRRRLARGQLLCLVAGRSTVPKSHRQSQHNRERCRRVARSSATSSRERRSSPAGCSGPASGQSPGFPEQRRTSPRQALLKPPASWRAPGSPRPWHPCACLWAQPSRLGDAPKPLQEPRARAGAPCTLPPALHSLHGRRLALGRWQTPPPHSRRCRRRHEPPRQRAGRRTRRHRAQR